VRSSTAYGAGRIGNLIVHSWPVQAAGLALITVLVTWAVTLFLTRKRVAWRAYLDSPINLAPTQLRYMGKRLTFKIYVDDTEDGHAVEVPWLVLLRIRNAGFVPVHCAHDGRRHRGSDCRLLRRSGASCRPGP
jgi:hypothetical protein